MEHFSAPPRDLLARRSRGTRPSRIAADPLTDEELDRLHSIEATIEPNISTFVHVGQCLSEIRRDKLYRGDGHRTFDQYLEIRWGFSRFYAQRIMDAAETALLLPNGQQKPPNERIARELTPLRKARPDLLATVYDTVVKTKAKATAREVRVAVRPVLELPPSATPDEAKQVVRKTLGSGGSAFSRSLMQIDRVAQEKKRESEAVDSVLAALRTLTSAPEPAVLRSWMESADKISADGRIDAALAWLKGFADLSEPLTENRVQGSVQIP
jgi:hypothetical protein